MNLATNTKEWSQVSYLDAYNTTYNKLNIAGQLAKYQTRYNINRDQGIESDNNYPATGNQNKLVAGKPPEWAELAGWGTLVGQTVVGGLLDIFGSIGAFGSGKYNYRLAETSSPHI